MILTKEKAQSTPNCTFNIILRIRKSCLNFCKLLHKTKFFKSKTIAVAIINPLSILMPVKQAFLPIRFHSNDNNRNSRIYKSPKYMY